MKKLFIITIVVVIAGFVGYFGYTNKKKLSQLTHDPAPTELPSDEQLVPGEPDPIFAEPLEYSSLNQIYNSTTFSFKYSNGFKALLTPISASEEVVTLENSKGSGFQVFSMAWDEPFYDDQGRPGPITPERIWQDEPDMEINDPKNADLDGTKALVFNSNDEDLGETFEVWVIHKGKLYQISGPKTAEKLIIETLETWSWK